MATMNIADTALNIRPDIIEYAFLPVPPGDLNFSWWLLNSFKSFSNSPNLPSLGGKEDGNVDIKALDQKIEEKGDFLETDLKENLLPEIMSLMDKYDAEEASFEKFLSLISTVAPNSQRELLAWSEIDGNLFLVEEAKAEENQGIPEFRVREDIILLDHQDGQDKKGAEQGMEKLVLFSGKEKISINFFIKENTLFNLAKANNLNFSVPKDMSKEGKIVDEQKALSPLNPILAEKIIKEEVGEMPKEMAKREQINLAFSGKGRFEQSGQDGIGLDMAIKNSGPSLVKEEGRKLASLWIKENNFRQFGLLGKENNESLAGHVEQGLNNIAATEKNFFFSFLKGEKKAETRLDDLSLFSPPINNKNIILSRDSFPATGEVGGKENIYQWRPAKAEIYKQISQKIIWSVHNDQEKIKVTLEPPHLGNIYLEVAREKENIRAKILAENPLTKELIEHSYWPIQKILEREGFRLERFDVFSQFDMNLWREAKEENLARNSQGKIYPSGGEINEPLSLEGSLPLEANKGCVNILI